MPTCKQCGSEFNAPIWKLDAVDFMQTEYGPNISRYEKLHLDAGVFCTPSCVGEYVEEGERRGASFEGAREEMPAIDQESFEMIGADEEAASNTAMARHGVRPGDVRNGILDVRGKSVPYILACRSRDGVWIAEIQLRDDALATGRGSTEQEALSNALSVITGERLDAEEITERTE